MVNYKVMLTKGDWKYNAESAKKLKDYMASAIRGRSTLFNDVVVYLLDSSEEFHYTNEKELSIYVNATPVKNTAHEGELVLSENLPEDFGVIEMASTTKFYFDYKKHDIYIPYTLSDMEVEEISQVISAIIKTYKSEILDGLETKDSWINSKQKDKLREEAVKYMRENLDRDIADFKQQVVNRTEEAQNRQRQLKEAYDNLYRVMDKLNVMETQEVRGFDLFLNGLDSIASHAKVEDVKFKERYVTIHTKPLTMWASIDGEMTEFVLGRATIKINMNNSEVRFDSDNKRRGYWTQNDPHPHVNGADGSACLGNTAESIAQMCADREIYGAFLIALSFLESANTGDSAGRKVENWDVVEKGVIAQPLPKPTTVEEETFICEYHDVECPISERTEVFTVHHGDGLVDGREYWSEDAVEDNATWIDALELYVSYEISEGVESAINE